MTTREALLLLVAKTSRAVEAAKLLRQLDSGAQSAERRALNLIRIAADEEGDLTDDERSALRAMAQPEQPQTEQRTETIRFRCTPNEKQAIQMLADKYAGGNLSKLLLQTLEEKYPTL